MRYRKTNFVKTCLSCWCKLINGYIYIRDRSNRSNTSRGHNIHRYTGYLNSRNCQKNIILQCPSVWGGGTLWKYISSSFPTNGFRVEISFRFPKKCKQTQPYPPLGIAPKVETFVKWVGAHQTRSTQRKGEVNPLNNLLLLYKIQRNYHSHWENGHTYYIIQAENRASNKVSIKPNNININFIKKDKQQEIQFTNI